MLAVAVVGVVAALSTQMKLKLHLVKPTVKLHPTADGSGCASVCVGVSAWLPKTDSNLK